MWLLLSYVAATHPSDHSDCVLSHSTVSNSLRPQGLWPARLCPWNFPRKNTGVGYHFLLQGIFPTQGSNTHLLQLLHWQADCLPLSHLGSPFTVYTYIKTPECTLEIFYNVICHLYLDKAKINYTYWILLPMQQVWVWFLGWKDPLEKKMTSNSSILAWEILWTKEPGGL